MPELPDVEVFRRYFDSTSLHQKISDVTVKDDRILEDVSAYRFSDSITGREFSETTRHGKNLFVHLDGGNHVLMHFGMTGNLKYFQNPDDEPKYTKVLFTFENGYHCAYNSMRMLGKVTLVPDITDYLEGESLGPDALKLTREQFSDILASRRGMIKSAFMDQSLIAGLGNIYTDEVLFQTRIHPKHQVQNLNEDQIVLLYTKVNGVLNTAIKHQVEVSDFPEDYLITHREQGAKCPECGGEIERIKVSSRSTYFCPDCQKN